MAILVLICLPGSLGCSGTNVGHDPCEGRQCGVFEDKDCGECPGETEVCEEDIGQCRDLCEGKECGYYEDVNCGVCSGHNEYCHAFTWQCTDRCEGRQCGHYYWAFCGTCDDPSEECEQLTGQCQDVCLGRECGEPVPGILCGSCEAPRLCGLPGRCFLPGGCPQGMAEVGLTGVCMDTHEATNVPMAEFLNEHGNECRVELLVDPNDRYPCSASMPGEGLYESDGLWLVEPGMEQYPTVGVTHAGAHLACQFFGKRLCTREELILACQGPEGHTYPYGDTYDPTRCNTCRTNDIGCTPQTSPLAVGSFPDCEGGYSGLFDLVGNVWERAAGPLFRENGDMYFPRLGGSAFRGENATCAAQGADWHAHLAHDKVGFRCCLTLE